MAIYAHGGVFLLIALVLYIKASVGIVYQDRSLLGTPQPWAFGFLNRVHVYPSVSNLYIVEYPTKAKEVLRALGAKRMKNCRAIKLELAWHNTVHMPWGV